MPKHTIAFAAVDPKGLIGKRAGPSGWRSVAQEQIDTFAQLSGDRQWIHVDVERARAESPYGRTIAHGNLTLAMVDGFRDELTTGLDGVEVGVNYGYERVRFPAAVPAGSRVRATSETLAVEARSDGWWKVVQRFVVELEDSEKPACVADSVVLVRLAG
ncbi:MAG: MaoC family dehydratase [Solirubrobacteraceae bacterium]